MYYVRAVYELSKCTNVQDCTHRHNAISSVGFTCEDSNPIHCPLHQVLPNHNRRHKRTNVDARRPEVWKQTPKTLVCRIAEKEPAQQHCNATRQTTSPQLSKIALHNEHPSHKRASVGARLPEVREQTSKTLLLRMRSKPACTVELQYNAAGDRATTFYKALHNHLR